jgi:hypothetical protein
MTRRIIDTVASAAIIALYLGLEAARIAWEAVKGGR